ncbi:hypothetical protein B4U80_06584 [Leptotrombidium deliense]|uniref:Uncharacterized protein n=1 Tax=Leptotrombidium deliense TaxID=299467 RepID=A0A443S1D9_9ACAR|nr:hypothetical protein B4U80_06584 [Leptotrombidium deliense]
MTRILGIDFAPIYLPLKRRLQTLAVLMACTWMVYDKDTFNKGKFEFELKTNWPQIK